MSEEKDKLLPHNYDGIQEYDNKLPKWWLYLFYVTIIIAIGYFLYFNVFKIGVSSTQAYEKEMTQALQQSDTYQSKHAQATESNLAEGTKAIPINSTEASARGAKVYKKICFTCHAADGGGSIGPNLTDKYWIHGNSIADIMQVIRKGVMDKGMPPKGGLQMSEEDISDLAYYIQSLQGTTPAKAKAPEGEKSEIKVSDVVESTQTKAMPINPVEASARGAKVYKKICFTCHAADGGGSIGPNLTDKYWIHGNSIADIMQVIQKGVIDKGMPPKGGIQMSQDDIRDLSYYIQSLEGTTPAKAKAPEGKKVE